jgi:hypothetical protein
MKINIIVILLIATSMACTKIIDSKVNDLNETKLVINCIITPDSNFSAYLSYSKSVLSDSIFRCNSASVFILDNQNNILDTLKIVNTGYYLGVTKPELNKVYKLLITNNNDTFASTTSIPLNNGIDSAEFITTNGTLQEHTINVGTQNLFINDNASLKNYYEIRLIDTSEKGQIRRQYNLSFVKNSITENEDDYFRSPNSLYFSDKTFNGTLPVLKFKSFAIYPVFIFYTRFLSEEYYNYLKYFTRYKYSTSIDNDGTYQSIDNLLFVNEPLKMYSNISGNAYGIFAGYSSKYIPIYYH